MSMIYFYENNSKKAGIYEIRNRFSNRSYIGQTGGFYKRWAEHKRSLIYSSRKANKFLQNDFNKCKNILNHDNFLEFHIIELMEGSTKNERSIREEFWISEYLTNGYTLYNSELKPTTQNNFSCYNQPEIAKRKISEATKRNWQDPVYRTKTMEARKGYVMTAETKKKMSIANKKPNPGQFKKGMVPITTGAELSEEVRKNISNTVKELWKNEEYKQNIISKNKGKRSSIKTEFKKGSVPHNKGVSMSNNQKDKQRLSAKKFCKIVYFLSPNFEIIKCEGLRPFVKEYNLARNQVQKLINGKVRSHKGWSLFIGPLQN